MVKKISIIKKVDSKKGYIFKVAIIIIVIVCAAIIWQWMGGMSSYEDHAKQTAMNMAEAINNRGLPSATVIGGCEEVDVAIFPGFQLIADNKENGNSARFISSFPRFFEYLKICGFSIYFISK